MAGKEKILICGILPPPLFGHSAIYKILMESSFVDAFDITFLDMKFWSFSERKRVTIGKLLKLITYYFQYIGAIVSKCPRFVLYNMSFYKMPFLKDFLFCATGIILGRRIIIHDMGQYLRELYDSSGNVKKAMIRWLLKHTTACILLGENTKEVYDGFIDRRRLFTVPGSVEETRGIVIEDIKEKSSEDVNVLYFSYLSQSKGVLTAFKAATKVLEASPSIRFTFVGPVESEDIQQEFDWLKKQYNSRIEYLGYIQDTVERTKVFRNTDIFIFPTNRDVFGLVLLHAMAEECPVIASIEGSVPEIIKDGENGFLIKKGDHGALAEYILKLAEDRSLRETIGKANRKRYEEVYVPGKYGRKMIDTLNAIKLL